MTWGSVLSTESRVRSQSKSRRKDKTNCTAPMKNGKLANAATEKINDALVLSEEINDGLVLSVNSYDEAWCLNSGASFHSCTDAELTDFYTPGDYDRVHLADNEPMKVMGKGDVRISNPKVYTLQLYDVRHVDGVQRNLISIGTLIDEGYYVIFGYGQRKVTKGAMLVARGKKRGTLYSTLNVRNNIVVTEEDHEPDL